MSNAGSVGPFRIVQRVGTSVWKAEDTRTGKTVALKILSKQLPKEAARREALIREVRVAAALYHSSVVLVLEVLAVGDNLLLVMDFIDGQSVSKHVSGVPLSRGDFFKMAYQLVDAVRFLHSKGLTHANVNTDSVLVSANGQVRLAGFNLSNLLPRTEGIGTAYQHRGGDARSVAYMAPEQITGQSPTGTYSDVYALGVVMYEMSTGKLPYQASNAPEFAKAIVEGHLISPKAAHPNIDPSILNILGRTLFKDSYRRPKDAKALVEEIAKADPNATKVQSAAAPKASPAPSPAIQAAGGESILFIADVANYDEIAATDQGSAARAAARMQQILGEAVYLFDGQVLDPFGKMMVAELPSVENALEAARKGEFDFRPEQQGDTMIPVRLLLHAGSVEMRDGAVGGETIRRAAEVLQQLPPLQLYLSEAFLKKGRGTVRVKDAGARAGVKLYTIAPIEGAPTQISTSDLEEIAVAEAVDQAAAEASARDAARRRRQMRIGAGLAALVVLVAVIAWVIVSRRSETVSSARRPARSQGPTSEKVVRAVSIAPFVIQGPDANGAVAALANAVRRTSIEILRTHPDARLLNPGTSGAQEFSATFRKAQGGAEMILPATATAPAVTVPVPDVGTGVRALLERITAEAKLGKGGITTSPEAMKTYVEAVAATERNDIVKTDAAVKATLAADPGFLAAQVLAMRFYSRQGRIGEAAAAGREVVALDPTNAELGRTAARLMLSAGDVRPAFAAYGTILRNDGADLEALTHVARYAASVGDADRFTLALSRLNSVPPALVPVHAPDILVATGRMESAIDRYYDIEVNVPNNPALSLKIGRISVLRRSLPIAELELAKLQQTDPQFGYHLLKAYILASQNKRAEAESELDMAGAASAPGDDYWTSAAEVYAMLGAKAEVLDALTKATSRKEPTSTYIINNPLFRYLRSDPQFQKLRVALASQQDEVREALAQIRL